MSIARIVDLKELGVDVDTFEKIYRMGEEDGRADERTKTIEKINTFCTEYNNKFKCIGECSKCPLGSFKEHIKEKKNEK